MDSTGADGMERSCFSQLFDSLAVCKARIIVAKVDCSKLSAESALSSIREIFDLKMRDFLDSQGLLIFRLGED